MGLLRNAVAVCALVVVFTDRAPLAALAHGAVDLALGLWGNVTLVVGLIAALYVALEVAYKLEHVPVVTLPAPKVEGGKVKSGALKDPSKPNMIQCFNPSTMEKLGEIPVTPPAELRSIVERSRKAQSVWARTSSKERRRVLRMLHEFTMANRDAICRVSMMDTGKTNVEALLGEIMVTAEKIRWVNARGEGVLAPEYRDTSLLTLHKNARVEYHPCGVLGVIAPWNYPYHNLINHVISGLFTGNAILLKSSEYSAWSMNWFADGFRAVLNKAGHATDLVQIVHGFAETGAALVNSGVDKVVFTGSPGVGRHIMRGASATLTPCVLELGGKDPFIICEDADLNAVVQIALRGTYQNCGQNCIGIERVYAYDAIHDEFVGRVLAEVKKFRQGYALEKEVDVGAMTMPSQIDHIQRLVDDAVAKGAKVLTGGKRNKSLEGFFYEPTILVGVTHDMEIANEEVFGPVMTIIRVKSDADCIAKVNSTPYGLGSSVFTLDTVRGERIAAGIKAGMTNVNDFAMNYLVQSLPFGGVRDSGFDRFGGVEGLRACCHMKSVVTDKFPGVRTSIPPPMAYPMKQVPSERFAKGLIDMTYSSSWVAKAKGVVALARS